MLFKPRWQAKDAATRHDAVARDQDAELLATLPEIARTDADAGVRLAALRRVADVGLAQKLAHDDPNAGVRSAALSLWHDLLAGTHTASPPLIERLRLLRAQDAPVLIEHLLRHGVEPELRGAALARVERPALLAERAIEDPDATVRITALERIDDEAQLARLAEKVRKRDKHMQRLARERIDALQIARGDSTAIAEHARTLCEELEQLAHGAHSEDRDAQIETRWQAIADKVPAAFALRFDNARQLLERARGAALTAASPPAEFAPIESLSSPPSGIDEESPGSETSESAAEMPASDEPLAGDTTARSTQSEEEASESESTPDRASEMPAISETLDSAAETESVSAEVANAADSAAGGKDDADDAEREARNDIAEPAPRAESGTDPTEERARRQQQLAAIETALANLADALESGETAQAHAAHARMTGLRREYRERLPRALHARFALIEPRYAQLRQWQRWADNQRRRQLCAELEALSGSGLHPDAIATRVRETQAEWQALDASEGGQRGGRASSSLARHFHTLCRAVLEPAKPYFEKRQELRQTQAQEVVGLLGRIDSIDADPQPAPAPSSAFISLRRETAAALRDLDRVEPRERKVLAHRLRDALTKLDARIDAHFTQIESARDALIANAQALGNEADVRTAITQARVLQKRWQEIGNGRRSRDQAQWKAFRAALDAVFSRADAEREAQAAQESELRDQAETLCAELEALAQADSAPERGAVSRIETAWRAVGSLDEPLRRRYRSAHDALQETLNRHARARRRVPYDTWLARWRLGVAAAQPGAVSDSLKEQWPEPIANDIDGAALQQRFDAALAGESAPGSADATTDVLIELEQLADIESPAADRERRMQLRLEKLSGHLRGADSGPIDAEFTTLLKRWTRAARAPDEDSMRRFERAFDAIVDSIMRSQGD